MHNHPHTTVLEALGVEIWRGNRCLCEDLSFRVSAGQLAHIKGPNGSGKTSLIRVLTGLGRLDGGEIRWCDRPISSAGVPYVASLAYLGHRNGIKPGLTPLENLAATKAMSPGNGLDPATALTELGLERFRDIPCGALSAGQQRRTALARLLLSGAPLWLLDEPLTSLDVAGVELVTRLLHEHLERGGLVILATHQSLDTGAHPVVAVELTESWVA